MKTEQRLDPHDFGRHVLATCRERKISLRKLAAKLGVSHGTMYNVSGAIRDKENRLGYGYDLAQKICAELSISCDLIPKEVVRITDNRRSWLTRAPASYREEFALKIRAKKVELGIDSKAIAERAGLSKSVVDNALWGNSCAPGTALALCRALGMNYCEIPREMLPNDPETALLDAFRAFCELYTYAGKNRGALTSQQEHLDNVLRCSIAEFLQSLQDYTGLAVDTLKQKNRSLQRQVQALQAEIDNLDIAKASLATENDRLKLKLANQPTAKPCQPAEQVVVHEAISPEMLKKLPPHDRLLANNAIRTIEKILKKMSQ